MTIGIKFFNGRWLVNNKTLPNMNQQERLFMDSFFREVKINSLSLENYMLNEKN